METTNWNEILTNIFAKPELPETAKLSPMCKKVVEIAQSMGIEIPVIILRDGYTLSGSLGCVDSATYEERVIIIWKQSENIYTGKIEDRTEKQIASTLAHELGHIQHMMKGEHYENAGFKYCEDYADNVRYFIMNQL